MHHIKPIRYSSMNYLYRYFPDAHQQPSKIEHIINKKKFSDTLVTWKFWDVSRAKASLSYTFHRFCYILIASPPILLSQLIAKLSQRQRLQGSMSYYANPPLLNSLLLHTSSSYIQQKSVMGTSALEWTTWRWKRTQYMAKSHLLQTLLCSLLLCQVLVAPKNPKRQQRREVGVN